ncbi:hypothetical protein [Collimonas sp.]|jgi:hypothetical protein|uniref:hypothetical protein n=1 Tax=Collimonas sp. TaxID=1963772 RepID=UPI002C13A86D|nr:hypothetical protein [Collimonas sp.]HWW06929.1 hypothetical protein [Collimonas sp.]
MSQIISTQAINEPFAHVCYAAIAADGINNTTGANRPDPAIHPVYEIDVAEATYSWQHCVNYFH